MSSLVLAKSKKCAECLAILPLEKFHKHRGTSDGRQSYCKYCYKKKNAAWVRDNPERQRERTSKWWFKNSDRVFAYNVSKVYGLSKSQYDSILIKQGGGCAICGVVKTTRRLGVDHNHKTGRIRGILCGKCNTAIGLLYDNTGFLANAIIYLKKDEDSNA